MTKYSKPLTILLAEDNQDHAELMIDTLKEYNLGNEVIHVHNGEDVLKYLRRQPPFDWAGICLPDIILLDLKMPRLDGIGALKEIRADDNYRHIPVVMVSTSSMEKEINTCFSLGANSYITKPLQFEEFTRKIKELNLYWVLVSELPRC